MTPRDRYTNFSALIYQNLGTTLAPLAGFWARSATCAAASRRGMPDLSNIQPSFVAAYGEPDRITIASHRELPGHRPGGLLTGAWPGSPAARCPWGNCWEQADAQPALGNLMIRQWTRSSNWTAWRCASATAPS